MEYTVGKYRCRGGAIAVVEDRFHHYFLRGHIQKHPEAAGKWGVVWRIRPEFGKGMYFGTEAKQEGGYGSLPKAKKCFDLIEKL